MTRVTKPPFEPPGTITAFFTIWVLTRPRISGVIASTRGTRRYTDAKFKKGDGLLFGPETRGLPESVLQQTGSEQALRLPMLGQSRSMNLSNVVAAGLFEALRQLDFEGLD